LYIPENKKEDILEKIMERKDVPAGKAFIITDTASPMDGMIFQQRIHGSEKATYDETLPVKIAPDIKVKIID
jgi:hypothetical protein